MYKERRRNFYNYYEKMYGFNLNKIWRDVLFDKHLHLSMVKEDLRDRVGVEDPFRSPKIIDPPSYD